MNDVCLSIIAFESNMCNMHKSMVHSICRRIHRRFKHPPLAPILLLFFLLSFTLLFFARLLVRDVSHVQEYPYPVFGKQTQLFFFFFFFFLGGGLWKKNKSPGRAYRSH